MRSDRQPGDSPEQQPTRQQPSGREPPLLNIGTSNRRGTSTNTSEHELIKSRPRLSPTVLHACVSGELISGPGAFRHTAATDTRAPFRDDVRPWPLIQQVRAAPRRLQALSSSVPLGDRLLRVPEQHGGGLGEDQRVVDAGEPGVHRPLQRDHRLRLIHVQNGHTVNRRRRIVAGRRVGDIVRADHQGDVGALCCSLTKTRVPSSATRAHPRIGAQARPVPSPASAA